MTPPRVTLPATADYAFWASLALSWIAQESDGLLDVGQPVVWFFAAAALGLTGLAVYHATLEPWTPGSMKLAPSFAKIMFIAMIVLTATWIFVGIAHTRTPTAQALYGLCAVLSGWSAWAMFVAIRD
jgi:FtsH-binding integral membrane protein